MNFQRKWFHAFSRKCPDSYVCYKRSSFALILKSRLSSYGFHSCVSSHQYQSCCLPVPVSFLRKGKECNALNFYKRLWKFLQEHLELEMDSLNENVIHLCCVLQCPLKYICINAWILKSVLL